MFTSPILKKIQLIVGLLLASSIAFAQPPANPAHIDAYITPYYNSVGPSIAIGQYSAGLASKDEAEVVATILKMKKAWGQLSFIEMHVGAIRLYDLGYRKESIYWFYTAQYQARLVISLLDPAKLGKMGDPGFELSQAGAAFTQLTGPYINGYAFGDPDYLDGLLVKVQKENLTIPAMAKIYPGVVFRKESEWKDLNKQVNDGLDKLTAMLTQSKDTIKKQRTANGMDSTFGKLTSKDLPAK